MLISKVEKRIEQILAYLEACKYQHLDDLHLEVMETTSLLRTPPTQGTWHRAPMPYSYGSEWTYYWFRSHFRLPESAHGKEVFLRLEPNADSLVFINGRASGAVNPRHDTIRLCATGKGGAEYTLHVESYAGHKYPGTSPLGKPHVILTLGAYLEDYPNLFRRADIAAKSTAVYSLFYDARTLYSAAGELDANSLRRNRILSGLYEALGSVSLTAEGDELEAQAKRASAAIAPLLSTRGGDTVPDVFLIGHAHIDHAWLWPISETVHKAARTFANMARLAEEFPEFVFVQSQPAQLEAVRREYPDIFEAVKAAYTRGQWEPNGGMWIEADCNIPNGESLIRQFLVGKQTSRELLGYEGDTLWLPDVFGYAAALPQILSGCEIEYFVTSKINWNDTTRFPYDTFLWVGIDGTPVKTHYITSRIDGYNGRVRARELTDAWNQVQHKEVQSAVIKPIGEGDGGGGTTRGDLETARRLSSLEGLPRARWIGVTEALQRIFSEGAEFPQWRGELYLELHRGTYTTQAHTKRYNRKLEFMLRECELLYSMLAVIGRRANGAAAAGRSEPAVPAYPKAELDDCWKKLLTNQFHDIIPGSSITKVYQDAEAAYREVEAELTRLNGKARAEIASLLAAGGGGDGGGTAAGVGGAAGSRKAALVALNSMSWPRRGMALLPNPEAYAMPCETSGGAPIQTGRTIDDEPMASVLVEAPSMGARGFEVVPARSAAVSPFVRSGRSLTTPHYRVRFDEAGRIESLFDIANSREVTAAGERLNALIGAEDIPVMWDAWDIDADWVRTAEPETRCESEAVVSDGPIYFALRHRYRIGAQSILVQDVVFYAHSRRIDFVTRVDWRESHRLLKVEFPVAVMTNQVRCEVQFGSVLRNTHSNLPTDRAQFEVCAHKWICVEEPGCGVALLNDCKYGCDVDGSRMRLTLLRSPKAPDPEADMGIHYFTYALLPYSGDFVAAGVVHEAYDLNDPLSVVETPGAGQSSDRGSAVKELSFLGMDNPNIVIETVKAAEEGGRAERGEADLVVRLYETAGAHQRGRLSSLGRILHAEQTNMLERKGAPCSHGERHIELELRPFEIRTLKLRVQV